MFDGSDLLFGFGGMAALLIGAAVYLLFLLITLWIAYLIIRAAVTNGILRAARQGAFRSTATQVYPQGPPHNQGGPYGQ